MVKQMKTNRVNEMNAKYELTEAKKAKLEKALNAVNKGQRTRKLELDDAIAAIECAAEEVMKVRSQLRQFVEFEYIPHTVAKAYNYPAVGTGIIVTFNKSGTVQKMSVARHGLRDTEYNRLVISYTAIDNFKRECLGIEREDQTANQRSLLDTIILSEMGFNHHGTKLL